jgi:hypothetical protein
MKRQNTYVLVGALVLILVLFAVGKITRQVTATTWPGTDIACIASHDAAVVHFHPHLDISVDGVAETIPANIGISDTCMANLHTHDTSGTIHVESADAGAINDFVLGDFFTVWNQPIERSGYTLTAMVNGQSVAAADLAGLKLLDDQQIVFNYITIDKAATSTDQDTGVERAE